MFRALFECENGFRFTFSLMLSWVFHACARIHKRKKNTLILTHREKKRERETSTVNYIPPSLVKSLYIIRNISSTLLFECIVKFLKKNFCLISIPNNCSFSCSLVILPSQPSPPPPIREKKFTSVCRCFSMLSIYVTMCVYANIVKVRDSTHKINVERALTPS